MIAPLQLTDMERTLARLARCERGYLAYTASVLVPLLLIVAAVSIDGAQYYSARKIMQSAANEAATLAYDARKRGRDPQDEAVKSVMAAATRLARVESVSLNGADRSGSQRVELLVKAKLILPVTTGIFGIGVTADMTGVSGEGRKGSTRMVEDARSQTSSNSEPTPVIGVDTRETVPAEVKAGEPYQPAKPPPPPPPPRVILKD